MNLRQLLELSGVGWRLEAGSAVQGAERLDKLVVRVVAADSRAVRPGDLFVAVDGLTVRGLDFAPQAIALGAVAVLADRPAGDLGVPVVLVDDARAALGPLASALHGDPSHALQVLAITGTNGKTTTAVLAAQMMQSAGLKTAAIGTLGLWTAQGLQPGQLTTPDAVTLQGMLAGLVAQGYQAVTLEASSHALDQRRLEGTRFAAAAWTNLSRDHLDYHGDEATYAAAKARLFEELLVLGAPAFVNGDDHQALRMREAGLAEAWSFGQCAQAEHQIAGVEVGPKGIALVLHSPGRAPLSLRAPLYGRHNAANLVTATLLCRAVGLDDEAIAAAALRLTAPPGRLQLVPGVSGALVLVDYAHTPDALAHALRSGRELLRGDGKLRVVFGCGGERDRGKRPEMGRVAGQGADQVVITSDNPRGEAPESIIDEIEPGLRAAGALRTEEVAETSEKDVVRYERESDRRVAIAWALRELSAGDVVLIAGKGHERTQTIAGVKRPFDDVEVAAELLAGRETAAGSLRDQNEDASFLDGFAFDGAEALAACGGRLRCAGERTTTLCTDSREAGAGVLFVALRGERFDANDFLIEVSEAGSAGVVCLRGRGEAALAAAREAGTWLLEVDDTLSALGDLALAHRRRLHTPIIGITGSNGKTTTKELLALALSAGGATHATFGNFNNRIGVPLTVAGLRAHHRWGIVEMGTSELGEIAALARIAAPQIGVVTSISEAHLEGLKDVESVAAEKAALLASLPSDGVAIVPADEPLLRPHLAALSCRVIRFGQAADADVRMLGSVRVQGMVQHMEADVLGTRVQLRLPGLGLHLCWNALGALAVVAALGENLHAAARVMSSYVPVGQRMRPLQLGPVLVLEDCYNANPRSSEVALQTLAGLPAPRVAVLGDMLELGVQGPALHARIGRAAMELGVERLVTLGAYAQDYRRGALGAGDASRVIVVDEIAGAVEAIFELVSDGGTVLVKGSRGAHMERVVQALRSQIEVETSEEGSRVSLVV